MKTLFIGNLIPEQYSVEIKANSLAGNKFQNKFVDTLRKKIKCDVLSFIAVNMTENQRKKIINSNSKINRYFYKTGNIFSSIFKYRNAIKKVADEYDIVFTYNIAYPWLFLPRIFKKKKKVLILADFSDSNSYKNPLLKLYAKICEWDIKHYDYVIGLSKKSEDLLSKKQKFIYIPGGIDLSDYNNVSPSVITNNTIKIMYSGNLSRVTGIDLLIEAVKKIKKHDLVLYITGRGVMEDYVKKESDGIKIQYMNSLPYDEYLKLLNSVNILVNPRNMSFPENQNNFPSKVFDYLAVGKMVVSTKFIGYEDFEKYFYFCNSDINSLKNTIESACKNYKKEYKKIFENNTGKAKEFDWNFQIQRIIDSINDEV